MDLEYVTTDELVAELGRRHDALVLIVARDGREDFSMESYFKGGFYTALGMVERTRYLMQANHGDGE